MILGDSNSRSESDSNSGEGRKATPIDRQIDTKTLVNQQPLSQYRLLAGDSGRVRASHMCPGRPALQQRRSASTRPPAQVRHHPDKVLYILVKHLQDATCLSLLYDRAVIKTRTSALNYVIIGDQLTLYFLIVKAHELSKEVPLHP